MAPKHGDCGHAGAQGFLMSLTQLNRLENIQKGEHTLLGG